MKDSFLIVWIICDLVKDMFLLSGSIYLVVWQGCSGWWIVLAIILCCNSDTLFKAYVSNNEGASWEPYGWKNEVVHIFDSSGTQAQVKFVLRGSGKRGAYVYSLDAINVLIRGTDISERRAGKNITLSKIQGT